MDTDAQLDTSMQTDTSGHTQAKRHTWTYRHIHMNRDMERYEHKDMDTETLPDTHESRCTIGHTPTQIQTLMHTDIIRT
jgi:hypothetical protein